MALLDRWSPGEGPMTPAVPDQTMPINRFVEFTASDTVASRRRRLGARTIPMQYEVRDASGVVVKQHTSNPVESGALSLWKVAVNGIAIFVWVIVAGLTMVGLAPLLWDWEPVVAMSDSMEPAIQASDIVITSPSNGEKLGEGTIVRYQSESGLRLGRIVAQTDDGYLIVNDGDLIGADTEIAIDADLIAATDISGVGVLVVPWVGLPLLWFQQGSWIKLILLATVAGALLYVSRRRWVDPRTDWVVS